MLPKIHKKLCGVDLFVALLITPHVDLERQCMNTSRSMFFYSTLTTGLSRILSRKSKDLGSIPKGATLCILSISSLHTNISNNECIVAVAEKLRTDLSQFPITNFILHLLKLVLHSHKLTFNGEHYLQTGGTATGTSVVPNYAVISWIVIKLKLSMVSI